jgi:hypothetical protein
VRLIVHLVALSLAIGLIAATHSPTLIGYANLPHLLAVHPLHQMLEAYDREIAALRSTETVSNLTDPSAESQRAAAALQRDVSATRSRVDRLATSISGQDRARERQALAAAAASESASDREMESYRDELARETSANLSAYASAIAQRTQRAYAAREQQLHENELTLAFDRARQNAGQRLMLRLKLQDLHLAHTTREKLQAEVAALNERDSAALADLRRTDSAVLKRYGAQLQRDGAVANAQMASQLRSKAAANLALRFRVLESEAESARILPDLSSRLGAFSSSYRFSADATAVNGGLRAARSNLTQRFAVLGADDRQSRAETVAQIGAIERARNELRGAMIVQIERYAKRLARDRHLASVVFSSRPTDSVDVTGALAAELVRF